MEGKRLLLVDLDGTVTNPEEGMTKATRYTLEQMGIAPLSQRQLRKFIGPPLKESFVNYCQLSASESNQAVSLYRDYFSVKGLFENYLYPDMMEVVQLLAERYTLAIATSKPEPYAN